MNERPDRSRAGTYLWDTIGHSIRAINCHEDFPNGRIGHADHAYSARHGTEEADASPSSGVVLDIGLRRSEGALASPEPGKMLPFKGGFLGTVSVEVTPAPNRQKIRMPKKIEKLALVFLRAAAIGCIVTLPILAWLPATILTRTGLGGHAEHLIAYLGTAIVIGVAFQESPRLIVVCVLLIVYAAALEAGQLYSTGRHASFQDLAFSAVGVLTGGLFLLMARILVLGSRRLGNVARSAYWQGELAIPSGVVREGHLARTQRPLLRLTIEANEFHRTDPISSINSGPALSDHTDRDEPGSRVRKSSSPSDERLPINDVRRTSPQHGRARRRRPPTLPAQRLAQEDSPAGLGKRGCRNFKNMAS